MTAALSVCVCVCKCQCECVKEIALTSERWYFSLIGHLHSCMDVASGTRLDKVTQV